MENRPYGSIHMLEKGHKFGSELPSCQGTKKNERCLEFSDVISTEQIAFTSEPQLYPAM